MESPRSMLQILQQFRRTFSLAILILAGVLTLHSNASLLNAQSTEICDNGIDDDGDTLIDCEDDDCAPGIFRKSGLALANLDGQGVALGDLDNDGDFDAFVVNEFAGNSIFLNPGGVQGGNAGDFVDSGQSLGTAVSVDVALGDLAGDGGLDAWVANSSSQAK